MLKSFLYDDIFALNFCAMDEIDTQEILTMRNDKQVAQWMYSQNISLESHLGFVNRLKTDSTSCYWAFKKESQILGVGSLSRIDICHKHAYIGIYKNPKLHKVGHLILGTLEKIAYFDFALHSLHLEVLAHNSEAIRFYEAHAYTKEGELKDFIYRESRFCDVHIYGKILPLYFGDI